MARTIRQARWEYEHEHEYEYEHVHVHVHEYEYVHGVSSTTRQPIGPIRPARRFPPTRT